MHGTQTLVVGRELELAAVEQFVLSCSDGPSSLVLEGAAGVGKTAIWAESIAKARRDDVVVRSCQCGEADSAWTFAGLGDLLDGIDPAILADLPPIQQQALAAAMLTSQTTAGSSGDRVVAVAILGALRALARTAPVLIAVDDVQWLDSSTRRVLSFALRRLRDEPVRLLASRRVGSSTDVVADPDLGLPGERLLVGPVNVGTVARILQNRLTLTLSRPTLTRLHHAAGGNPMVCLEMGRALQRHGHEPKADEPLPVPADLRLLVTQRLSGLHPESRRLLLLCSAMALPTVDGVAAAMGDPRAAAVALAEVLTAGVVERDGARLRFTHPLLASIPYADLLPEERRSLHQGLAAVVADPQEHARHAGLASPGPGAAVASALDLAARQARSRGSLESAAELAELAIDRTPSGDTFSLLERRVEAADHHFRLGNTAKAREMLNDGLGATAPGPARVRGLLLLATVISWEEGDEKVAEICDRAMTEAGDDQLLLARCHATFAETGPCGPEIDLLHARTAVRMLENLDSPPPDLLSNALTNVALHGLRLGNGLAVSNLEQAAALETAALETAADRPGILERAGMGLGMGLKHIDRFEDSRSWLQTMLTSAVDEGDDSALPMILGQLALLECWAGSYQLALSYAVRGRQVAEQVDIKLPALDVSPCPRAGSLGADCRGSRPGPGRPGERRVRRVQVGPPLASTQSGVCRALGGQARGRRRGLPPGSADRVRDRDY